jgi:hypothetical protein
MQVSEKMIPNRKALGTFLFSETDLFDQLAVVLQVIVAQVSQQSFSLSNQLHQPAMGREIFFIFLKMIGNAVNPFSQ